MPAEASKAPKPSSNYALRVNGDIDNYWHWHLTQERHRTHETRYANNQIPHVA